MTLSARDRAALYEQLSTVVDPKAVEAMLSHFPARDLEEPITREFLRAEMANLRAELHIEMGAMEAGIRHDMATMETRLVDRMHTEIRRSSQWLLGAILMANGALAAVITLAR